MASKLDEIKASILEIRDCLSEPLKGFLNKKIKKTEAYFEKDEPPSEIHIIFFNGCLDDAKKCKKIETDFPSRWYARLTADPKLFDTLLYKLFSVCVLDNSPGIDKVKDKIYTGIKETLENLLNSNFCQIYKTYQVRDSIKKNILELLILLLSKKEYVSFDEEYVEFFTYFSFLINHSTISLNYYLDKIDKIEDSNCFSLKNLTDIRRKYFEIIFLIDRSIIYRNLLAKIEEVANNEFSDHLALLRFINHFVFTLINKKKYFYESLDENPNESLYFGMVLIYQALNKKYERENSAPNVSFFNRLIKSSPKSTLGGQLSKFKRDYYDKTGEEFLEEALSSGQFGHNQVQYLPDEIAVYFDMLEINRSPDFVIEAFNITLRTYNAFVSSEEQQTQTVSEEVNTFQKIQDSFFKAAGTFVGTFTEKAQTFLDNVPDKMETWRERGQDVLEKGQEMKEGAMGLVKGAVNNVTSRVFGSKEPPNDSLKNKELIKQKLKCLQVKLNDIIFQIGVIQLFLETKINRPSVVENISKPRIIIDENLSDLNEENINLLERQSTVIDKIIGDVYISAINKSQSEIKNRIQSNSWFENKKFSLKRWVKYFFTNGCFYVNLDKLKTVNGLNDQIDFVSTKNFFIKAGFYSLLRFGVIRWPWLNKKDFATKWAEQIALLKARDYIEKTTNEDISCKDINSKTSFLLELLKLHSKIFYDFDTKPFLSDLYQDFNEASINHLPEVGRLLRSVDRRITIIEMDSPAELEVNLDNITGFFNARNKEQGSSSESLSYRTPSNPSI